MKYKQSVLAIAGTAAIALHAAQTDYKDPALTVEERVGDLVGRMTIAEKVAQLSTARGYTAYEIRNGER